MDEIAENAANNRDLFNNIVYVIDVVMAIILYTCTICSIIVTGYLSYIIDREPEHIRLFGR
jgi:hypothetical protein